MKQFLSKGIENVRRLLITIVSWQEWVKAFWRASVSEISMDGIETQKTAYGTKNEKMSSARGE